MIQAINNYCLLEMIQVPSEIDYGGIFIPNTTTKTPRWGTVKSVGPGVPDFYGNFVKPDVDENDLVYVSAHGQYEVYTSSLGSDSSESIASILDIIAVMKDKEKFEIQPLGSYIEIEPIEFESTGISLPEDKRAPTNIAKVVSLGLGLMGPDGKKIPMQVKVGDTVVYNPLRTVLVDFITLGEDSKKKLIQHNDIIGILKEENY